VGSADLLPIVDVCHVDPRSHDVGKRSIGAVQRPFDVANDLHGLRVRITSSDELAVLADRRGAGDVDDGADADRSGVADDWLPWSPGREVLSLHYSFSPL
jgi:hypothetical protein